MSVESTDMENGVRLIRFSGQSATQSFSREFLPLIAKAIDAGLAHPNVRAMVLTGEGKFFSAGADIHAFAQSIEDGDAPQLIRDLTGVLHPLLIRMRQSPTICIAAINGACAGGGLGLALACDARIGSPSAKMAASYAGMGLSPDGGTTWLLPRLVGDQTSRRFFFENEIWSAEQAAALGAIDAIVEHGLIEAATAMALRWSQWGNHTKEATKHLLDVQSVQDFETHLKHERTLIEAAGTTEAFKEGVAAFIEKRKPEF
ncbi:MAG: enoyl-CoA hydratase/isomerase family protein [Candidatus Poseidoniaceae archaeon]|jgi:2-(1,2-epoxy-1,2-dihydrophenyl)acetyl-CoA isomerase|tara:strand:+ start:46 stop:822 length:777 start_codon:yes stop_codon:yes gene_type:complete